MMIQSLTKEPEKLVARLLGSRQIIICLALLLLALIKADLNAKDKNLLILLDPGHGGSQAGAEAIDGAALEKDLNLKIALYLKEDLEEYEGVEVSMTREDDSDVDLDRRSEIAEEKDADLLISLHNNAFAGDSIYDHGAFVLTAKGQYKKKLARKEQELACNILYELSEIGLEDQGILLRESEDGETYPNGKKTDYYRIVKAGIRNDRMQIIIEHAYVDNMDDFQQYLSRDESLKRLADADAKGIARYYGLKHKKTGESYQPLKNRYEDIVEFQETGKPKVTRKMFYKENQTFLYPWYQKYFPFSMQVFSK